MDTGSPSRYMLRHGNDPVGTSNCFPVSHLPLLHSGLELTYYYKAPERRLFMEEHGSAIPVLSDPICLLPHTWKGLPWSVHRREYGYTSRFA